MLLEIQNQQTQPLQLHVGGHYTAKRSGHNLHPSISNQKSFVCQHLLFRNRGRGVTNLLGTMSRRNGPKLDLKLNLSPPRANRPHVESPNHSLTVSPTSPPSSCISSELSQQDECLRYSTSPEATSMVLVGCPRCLMYVMLAEEDPRCPKCKSSVLLDVIHDNNTTTTTSRKARKS